MSGFGRRARPYVSIACLLLACAPALIQVGCTARARPRAPSAGERSFRNPTAAVEALLAACRTHDEAALVVIFGEQARSLVSSGDAPADRERCDRLVGAAARMTRLDPLGADAYQLVVGTDDWPFPIPLVRNRQGWHFDTIEGAQEVRRRHVGADELEAISFCRAYVRAQERYAATSREYAQRLVSAPGRRDGLYWPAAAGARPSPLAREVAAAGDYSKGPRPSDPWWGYYFRVLTGQGASAPGGSLSYVVNGRMVRGFALVAYPSEYRTTGVMTFLVGRDGQVLEKDLGERTDEIAAAMKEYDPDGSWKAVTD